MRKIFVVLFALALIGAVMQMGCGSKQTEEAKVEEAKAESPPDFTYSVDDFCREYGLLEGYGDIPFKGKIILLQGKVNSVEKDIPGIYRVYLQGGNTDPHYASGVKCEMVGFVPESMVTVGEEISIQGRCEGISGSTIIMEDCEIK